MIKLSADCDVQVGDKNPTDVWINPFAIEMMYRQKNGGIRVQINGIVYIFLDPDNDSIQRILAYIDNSKLAQ